MGLMRLGQKDTGLEPGGNYNNGRSFLILNRTALHGMNNFIFHANTEYHHVDTYKAIFTSDCSLLLPALPLRWLVQC
jgi:hypothetical protein